VSHPGPLQPIRDEVRERLVALQTGATSTGSVIPEGVRAAIHAGHVGQVVIFCDDCGVEEEGDYIGETREERFEAARRHLATTKGWEITHPGGLHTPHPDIEPYDLCGDCASEE
jgi:hypothetical protein